MRLRSRDLFQTVHTEGGLLPADLLQRIADGDRTLDGLRPNDYHLDPGERLNERITRAWTRLTSAWRAFDEARQNLPPGDVGGALTRDRWLQILFDELGYGRLVQKPAIQIEDKQYPIFSQWLNTPIHLVGARISLDQRTAGVRGAAGQSPHSLVQELLNRSPDRLWGIVSNGLILRVLHDNVSLTRQAYVQFDLEAMFSGEVYSDFALLWLICHESRVEAAKSENCWLERWSKTAADTGTRALDALRQGVEEAIETLGAGFLAHQANQHLHEQLADGRLDPLDYYRTLLRLVYRLLFLFVAEDRSALLDPTGDKLAKDRYTAHYSTAHLRELASKRRGGRHHDRYEQLKLVMAALHEHGQPALALPPLGSYLWDPAAIGPLAGAKLANEDLFAAVRSLATVDHENIRRAVDFRNLGAEELGSVYESLLELHPTVNRDTRAFELDAVPGSERKTTGSYYTPTALISSLLDSALEPVLDEAALKPNPEEAILNLAVVDPACGSGHFLIAAANRIAKRLAAIRSDDPEPSPSETRAALRDVVGRCIHGVDVNPMAVELCKVSLWMEALEPGRPLSFLDHRIVLGNSLLGTTPELISAGIPADAFKPILGDDKTVVTALRKRNEKEQSGQLSFDLIGDRVDADAHAIAVQAAGIASADDESLAGVREQQNRFQQLLNSPERQRAQLVADVWCTAFVAHKDRHHTPITQDSLNRAVSSGEAGLSPAELSVVRVARTGYSFLHWYVAFPSVWEGGGFDVVLGNPPWERTAFEDKPFFSVRAPEVLAVPTTEQRKRLIEALSDTRPDVYAAYVFERGAADRSNLLASYRFPLGSSGRTNTYGLFAELVTTLASASGRVGIVVPTGVATDAPMEGFWRVLVDEGLVVSLFDFENRAAIFPAVHRSTRFSLLTLKGGGHQSVERVRCAFFLASPAELAEPGRSYDIRIDLLPIVNPNTKQPPLCRGQRDLDLVQQIHTNHPILAPLEKAARARATRVMASTDKKLNPQDLGSLLERGGVVTANSRVVVESDTYMPLLEAKQIYQFDPSYATYDGVTANAVRSGEPRPVPDDLRSTLVVPTPRLWAPETAVEPVLDARGLVHSWVVGVRDITNATNERTAILAVLPRCGMVQPLNGVVVEPAEDALWIVAALNSFAGDYLARQKTPGTHLNVTIFNQLAVPLRQGGRLEDVVIAAALELSYVTPALAPFAHELGCTTGPFQWDVDRREMLRRELDAAFFHLYGINRDDAGYILETFPIVKRRDDERFGEYRSKRLILERYDAMVAIDPTGAPYETPLDPPPGDPGAAHPAPETSAVS